jgi:uncharacterized HhH-GPD family protein
MLSRTNVTVPGGQFLEHPFVGSSPKFHHAPFVAAALLELGGQLHGQVESRLATSPEADRFVRSNPFAFLVAVLLDQGVPAERAFAAPLLLRQRLGHLSPRRIAREPGRLRRAMRLSPMPHRYPDQSSTWIISASRRIVQELEGRTDRLWADSPTARVLRRRLERFDGIGQKKAAMAVEILTRDLRVEVQELSGSDVAVDVHIRRVFLRTKLASLDTIDEIVGVARRAHPERPGELDVPAWVVGRMWCRPRSPKCGACPISWACPSATSISLDPIDRG